MLDGLMERLAESPHFAGFKDQLDALVRTVQATELRTQRMERMMAQLVREKEGPR